MQMLASKLLEIRQREHEKKLAELKGENFDINFGSQIRSYVFHPYKMVKDHRTGFEMGNVYAVMDGELDGFIEIGKVLGFSNRECREAYKYACVMVNKKNKSKINYNINCLNNNNKKILLVSHPYNTYDCTIGKPIINYLEELGCSVIYSDLFDKKVSSDKSLELCEGLYWKFSKEIVGSIKMCEDKIDGVIFLSTFPCGLDSLVNELIIRKLDKKCLNIVLDDLDSFAGIETRLESFVDIV